MIDNFALGLTHALMAYIAWRLLLRDDLDDDKAVIEPVEEPQPEHKDG